MKVLLLPATRYPGVRAHLSSDDEIGNIAIAQINHRVDARLNGILGGKDESVGNERS
jgi:hypothetical protein